MENTVRLQVEVTQAVMDELERLMKSGGLKTKKDLLNTAFTLLKWAVREKAKGNAICSVNEQSMLRKELEMPFLEAAAASERSRTKESPKTDTDAGAFNQEHDEEQSADAVAVTTSASSRGTVHTG